MIAPALVLNVLVATPVALPGGPPVVMDYLAYDAASHKVWVPAGNTGRVDVVDEATGKVDAVMGFATAPSPRAGRPPVGPSSASVGDGVVWVGSRADHQVCAVDARTLVKKKCVQLASSPDGVAWVATTRELWVTTPRDRTLTIVDEKGGIATVALDGDPEGYAVDAGRGVFYTNLEDKDRTLAIDVRTRKVVATWQPGCGEAGPRGLAVDARRRQLFVACGAGGAAVLDLVDTENRGKVVGRVATGPGVDNIDYAPGPSLLYLAAGRAATLTVAHVDAAGAAQVVHTATTAPGARVVVVDDKGDAWVADSTGGRLLHVALPR